MLLLVFSIFICVQTVIGHSIYSFDNENPNMSGRSYKSDGVDECGATYPGHLFPISINSPEYGQAGKTYHHKIDCGWAFVGNKECVPTFSCKEFELQKLDSDCDGEYLEVSDGVGGLERFCGTSERALTHLRGKSRDLYIKFKSGSKRRKSLEKGFFCEIKCSKKSDSSVKFLEEPTKSPIQEEHRCVCGLQPTQTRIVGGEDVALNEFPWQVAIVATGTRRLHCGGSVINDRYILSAAHCFASNRIQPNTFEILIHARILEAALNPNWADVELGKPGSIQVPGFNESNKTDADENSQRFKIVEIINHPLYNDDFDYDVALLKLDRKIELTSPNSPTPICLPGKEALEEEYIGEQSVASGWGLPAHNAGANARILQKVVLPIIPLKTCAKWLPYDLTQRMICAGYEEGKRDACSGDSGGPLAIKKENLQWDIIGIVSWGESCAAFRKPGLYSRITELNAWIKYHSVGATWCRSKK